MIMILARCVFNSWDGATGACCAGVFRCISAGPLPWLATGGGKPVLPALAPEKKASHSVTDGKLTRLTGMRRRFEKLVDAHGGRLLQLSRFMLQTDSEAEDVVQDSLIKLWDHLPRLEAGSELAWLITCTRNACLDRIRRVQRQVGLQRQIHAFQSELGEQVDHNDPDAFSESAERARQLHAAIAELPEPGRSLVILREIQDVDVSTVARTLALTPNQVKVYTFRARRALRRQLEEACHEQVA